MLRTRLFTMYLLAVVVVLLPNSAGAVAQSMTASEIRIEEEFSPVLVDDSATSQIYAENFCDQKTHNPHRSSHYGGRVNAETQLFNCTAPVTWTYTLHLYREGGLVASIPGISVDSQPSECSYRLDSVGDKHRTLSVKVKLPPVPESIDEAVLLVAVEEQRMYPGHSPQIQSHGFGLFLRKA